MGRKEIQMSKVTVAKADIDEGVCGDGELCPVAIALTRTLNRNVVVEDSDISVYKPSGMSLEQRIPTPRIVKDFINKFDAGMPVEPFEFELDVEGVEVDG